MRRLTLLTALLVLLLTGACSSDDNSSDNADSTTTTAAKSEVHEVSVEAKEYSFGLPKEVPSGTVEFTLKNTGKEVHIAALERIKDGKTFSDATKDLQSATPPADPSSDEVGGIAATSPGGSSSVTLQGLTPGSYFFACFVPAADGTPHVAKGMIQPFTVTEDKADPASVPTAAGAVTAKDFSYTTTYKPTAGSQVISLTNEDIQGHEITLIEFKEGKGPGDLQALFANPAGEPPATFLRRAVHRQGRDGTWKTPPLEAGKSYFFMCLIPDPADGVPHAAKGMTCPSRSPDPRAGQRMACARLTLRNESCYTRGVTMFSGLADPTRLRIIEVLTEHDELAAGKIATHFDIARRPACHGTSGNWRTPGSSPCPSMPSVGCTGSTRSRSPRSTAGSGPTGDSGAPSHCAPQAHGGRAE